ncbi:MAG: hypothetical protein K6G01_07390 [Eubacterium sp.]|nr:hypothetical protein [Eubacterium sp.]
MEKFKRTVDLSKAIPFANKSAVVAKSASEDEIGSCVFPDGTGYICDVNYLDGITVSMLDWWYVWRGLKKENYSSLNPKEYLSAKSMQIQKSLDPDLDIHEKLWDTTQEVVTMGEMGPVVSFQNFKCPTDIGFDISALKDNASFICYRTFDQGQPPQAGPDGFVAHMIKETDTGVEITTHQWVGWTMKYGLPTKTLPEGFFMPPVFPVSYLVKNTMELMNLGKILPKLYEENGGKLQ